MPSDLVTFLQQSFNGLVISGIYILIALGITIQFGLCRLINFAQGAFLILGAFIAFAIASQGVNFFFVALGAGAAIGLLSLAAERTVFRRTLEAPMNGFVVSLGLLIIMEMMMVRIWSADTEWVPSPVHGTIDLGGVILTQQRLLVLGATVALVAGLFALLRYTGVGRAMRAVAEDREGSEFLGVNASNTLAAAFFIGGVLAGIGGALLGIMLPFTPFSGTAFIIKAFAVAIIGGLGNIAGAVLAGVLVGMVETYGAAYWEPGWKDGFAFVLMIIILLWRPAGLLRSAWQE
jgi:branched-chain amino acid transport system permease protein